LKVYTYFLTNPVEETQVPRQLKLTAVQGICEYSLVLEEPLVGAVLRDAHGYGARYVCPRDYSGTTAEVPEESHDSVL
jgi:hypothetical protein